MGELSVETPATNANCLSRGFGSYNSFETIQNTVSLHANSYVIIRQAAVNCRKQIYIVDIVDIW
jgi:hypothetical protein